MATPRTRTNGHAKTAPPLTAAQRRVVGDSMQNLVAGLGTTRDKSFHSTYTYVPLDQSQLDAAFRTDWIARKIVRSPAADSTREWRAWQAEQSDIEDIEEAEKILCIQQNVKRAVTLARLHGGSLMFLGIGNNENSDKELLPESVKKDDLKYAHVVSRHRVGAGAVIQDVTSPYYGQHSYYELTTSTGQMLRVHPSRVIKFLGEEVPDIIDNQGWGDSCLQSVDDAIKAVGLCSGGLAQLVWEMKFDVVKVPNLMSQIADADYRSRLVERFQLANVSKSIVNSLLLDKEEEWSRISQSLAGADDILKIYLLIASGAADIPATRLLGQSPVGLSATGESDVRNYYDRVASEQKNDLTPTIAPLDEILIRSVFGDRPEDIFYEWRPLWQTTEKEDAEIAKLKADVYKIDVDTALIPDRAMAQVRVNQLIEDGTYPGLEGVMEDIDLEEELESAAEELAAAEEARATLADPANENDPDADVPEGEAAPPARRARTADAWSYRTEKRRRARKRGPGRRAVKDATPKTLYVRRDVVNAAELLAWARNVGLDSFGELTEDLHVTIMYSRTAVDWGKATEDWNTDDKGQLRIKPGGMRMVDGLGVGGSVVGLLFTSENLSWRHCSIKDNLGCSWDWDHFQPHVTLVYGSEPISFDDLRVLEPYRGEIVLGPEIWEEVKTEGSHR